MKPLSFYKLIIKYLPRQATQKKFVDNAPVMSINVPELYGYTDLSTLCWIDR